MGFLLGNRAYITLGIATAAFAAFLAGLIDQKQLTVIFEGLGIPVAWFIKAAIDRHHAEVTEKVKEVKLDVADVKQDVQDVKQDVRAAAVPPPVLRTR